MATGVTGHLHCTAHVHDFRRAIVQVRLQFRGEAFEQVGGTVVPVVAQHRGIVAPGPNPLRDRHR